MKLKATFGNKKVKTFCLGKRCINLLCHDTVNDFNCNWLETADGMLFQILKKEILIL